MAFSVRYPILGSNYYPEAWDRKLIDDDLSLMQSLGLNCVRIAEFAWATIEPREGKFDFSIFREVVDKCRKRGIAVILGTPTACPPRWLVEKHPDIFLQGCDKTIMTHGARRNVCPNNETYRHYCAKVITAMAKEFAKDENVIGWQIDNEIHPEYGGGKNESGCCCKTCRDKFQLWLEKRYDGDIKKLNDEWGNYIFSQAYDNFSQVDVPHPTLWTHPSYSYHYALFQNESQQEFIKMQVDILKKYVKCPIGHDAMPTFALDYNTLSKNTDVMQYNHYHYGDEFWESHFWYDLIRPLKDVPFWNTETSCCWNGSTFRNYMRPKGFNTANVFMGIFAGAELTNFWLWREHYGGQELMHGACVSSAGRPLHIAKEIKKLSEQLDLTSGLMTQTKPISNRIGIHAPFTSYAMARFQSVAPEFEWTNVLIHDVYKPLFNAHYSPDVLVPSKNPDGYGVILSPFVFNLDEEDLGVRMLKWVRSGGTWIVGPLSDIRNRAGAKYIHSHLGMIEDASKIIVEFTLPKGEESHKLKFRDGGKGGICEYSMDALRVQGGAQVVATYANGDYIGGYACITETKFGKGKIVVLGAMPDAETLVTLVGSYAKDKNITPLCEGSSSLAVVYRAGDAGELLCATETSNSFSAMLAPFDCRDALTGRTYFEGETVSVEPYGVVILKKNK